LITNRTEWCWKLMRLLEANLLLPQGVRLPPGTTVWVGLPTEPSDVGSTRIVDGAVQIIVSVRENRTEDVMDILFHEMLVAATGVGKTNCTPFRSLARRLNMTGRAATARLGEDTPERTAALRLVRALGPYPVSEARYRKPRDSGRIRASSTTIPGYHVYISPRMIREHGLPRDPKGKPMRLSNPSAVFQTRGRLK
jgi:hypothetical protein